MLASWQSRVLGRDWEENIFVGFYEEFEPCPVTKHTMWVVCLLLCVTFTASILPSSLTCCVGSLLPLPSYRQLGFCFWVHTQGTHHSSIVLSQPQEEGQKAKAEIGRGKPESPVYGRWAGTCRPHSNPLRTPLPPWTALLYQKAEHILNYSIDFTYYRMRW